MAKPSPLYKGIAELLALGAEIKKVRQAVGMSQEELAYRADLDRSYVGGIERGEHNVALMSLVKLANALGVTVSELTKKV